MGSGGTIGSVVGGTIGAITGGPAGMAIGSGIGSALGGSVDEGRNRRAIKNNTRQAEAARDDLSMRREATYRASRQGLQNAIEDFYKQKGWALPDKKPGAFTTRGLPGEAPLYPEGGASEAAPGNAEAVSSTTDDSGSAAPAMENINNVDVGSMVGNANLGGAIEKPTFVPKPIVALPYDDQLLIDAGAKFGHY